MHIKDRFKIFKNAYSWQHDSLTSEFYNILKSKTCHFLEIMQTKLNFIYNNYKLSIATFDNIHQMESNYIYGGPINVRMTWWNIFHAFGFGSYMSWITFPNDNLVELFTKYFASQSSLDMTFSNFGPYGCVATSMQLTMYNMDMCHKNNGLK